MQQAAPVADAGAEDETVRMQTASAAKDGGQNPPASEDVTVAMPVIKADDAKTVALPVQRPDAPKQAGTDRVAPGPGRVPITKPPSTPRPAGGPKQPGPQGPSAPPQSGPAPVEDARPAPPQQRPGSAPVEDARPPQQRPGSAPVEDARPPQQRPGSAPSPADIQPTLPAQSLAGPRPPQPRPIAQPQRITPAGQAPAASESAPGTGRSKRWLLAVAGAAVLVVVLIGVAVVLITGSGGNSPEEKVRAAITDYTQALKKGDLNALRSTTCGPLHDFYQGIPADQFAGVHQLSMDRRNIPVIDGIDAIRITDKTAIAQATVYTEADPAKRSARTFDLQDTDGGWKVCDPPTSPQ
ncbi:hypothetical protein ACIBCD_08025 [Nocardia brasiliensis]|uniref:Rv0361 family membrane protein n=1 Tax=Nocardia brasiliensis TaxID=37326 RepID=UPI0037891B31